MPFRCGTRASAVVTVNCYRERVQKHVLRSLLPDAKYFEALAATGLATLKQRRVKMCRRFASGLQESPEFCNWLPSSRAECHGRNLRSKHKLTVLQPEHRDSCVAQLHTSQICSTNSLCSTLCCLSFYNKMAFCFCFLTNVHFYTL